MNRCHIRKNNAKDGITSTVKLACGKVVVKMLGVAGNLVKVSLEVISETHDQFLGWF